MTGKIKSLSLFIITFSFFINNVSGQDLEEKKSVFAVKSNISNKQQNVPELEKLITELMDKAVIPGLSISLIKNGKITFVKGFGVKNSEEKNAVDDITVYEACSLSKPVFAYAVMKLFESGRLDLDRPLMSYVSESYIQDNYLRNPIEDERFNKITARMVLTHTPGFPNWRRGKLNINFNPGDRFSYSGEGFVFLQKVVEHITGKTLNEFMIEKVFNPLGMKNSSYIWQEKYEKQFGFGHNFKGSPGGRRKRNTANGAASLYTTAEDYAKYVNAILNEQGLASETIRLIFSTQESVNSKINEYLYWGLGFGIEKVNENTYPWHWGDNGNYKCFFIADKNKKNAVIYFTNSSNGLSITEDIVKSTLGGIHPVFKSSFFDGYERHDSFTTKFNRILHKNGVDFALRYYRNQNEKDPKNILEEGGVNQLGYQLLRNNRIPDAIKIFKLNVELYPESSNVYDSLGEAYMKNGDKELAIKNYEKSLELNPDNDNAIQMLKRLREK